MKVRQTSIIYIPIWLDLLFSSYRKQRDICAIYIPIWLDLLYSLVISIPHLISRFTFQYG